MARTKEARNAWLRDWCKRNPVKRFGRYFRARMRNKYGWPPERYDYALMAQHNRCLICQRFLDVATPENRTSKTARSAVVDHDPETDEVRAILCNNCNRGLGLFSHDPGYLLRASQYMQNWNHMKELDRGE